VWQNRRESIFPFLASEIQGLREKTAIFCQKSAPKRNPIWEIFRKKWKKCRFFRFLTNFRPPKIPKNPHFREKTPSGSPGFGSKKPIFSNFGGPVSGPRISGKKKSPNLAKKSAPHGEKNWEPQKPRFCRRKSTGICHIIFVKSGIFRVFHEIPGRILSNSEKNVPKTGFFGPQKRRSFYVKRDFLEKCWALSASQILNFRFFDRFLKKRFFFEKSAPVCRLSAKKNTKSVIFVDFWQIPFPRKNLKTPPEKKSPVGNSHHF